MSGNQLECPFCGAYEVDRLYLGTVHIDACTCTGCARWDLARPAATGAVATRSRWSRPGTAEAGRASAAARHRSVCSGRCSVSPCSENARSPARRARLRSAPGGRFRRDVERRPAPCPSGPGPAGALRRDWWRPRRPTVRRRRWPGCRPRRPGCPTPRTSRGPPSPPTAWLPGHRRRRCRTGPARTPPARPPALRAGGRTSGSAASGADGSTSGAGDASSADASTTPTEPAPRQTAPATACASADASDDGPAPRGRLGRRGLRLGASDDGACASADGSDDSLTGPDPSRTARTTPRTGPDPPRTARTTPRTGPDPPRTARTTAPATGPGPEMASTTPRTGLRSSEDARRRGPAPQRRPPRWARRRRATTAPASQGRASRRSRRACRWPPGPARRVQDARAAASVPASGAGDALASEPDSAGLPPRPRRLRPERPSPEPSGPPEPSEPPERPRPPALPEPPEPPELPERPGPPEPPEHPNGPSHRSHPNGPSRRNGRSRASPGPEPAPERRRGWRVVRPAASSGSMAKMWAMSGSRDPRRATVSRSCGDSFAGRLTGMTRRRMGE